MVNVTVDGQTVQVPAGATLREVARVAGTHTPTLCWHPHFPTGANCRACVVELAGSRVLVPSCSRVVEEGMVVQTDSSRVRLARRTVFELLLSQVDLAAAPELQAYAAHYGADPARFTVTGRERTANAKGAHPPPPALPPLQDNPFFARDYARCILCQRCTEACGTGVQHTFAIALVGRGAGATIGTGGTGLLPDSPCVFCGNCVGVCPSGALMPLPNFRARAAGEWEPTPMSWHPAVGLAPTSAAAESAPAPSAPAPPAGAPGGEQP